MTVALLSASGATSAPAPARLSLQECIAGEAKKSDFSGVISIATPKGSVQHAQGLMAGPGSAAMLSNAQFNIGSASKMWTAVAVAQLVDAKKLTLDDPIGRYVSGLTPEAAAVTIRQLLTHSGGLGNFFALENMAVMQRARSLSDLKPLVVADKPAFKPGARSQYSNSGFLLLGLMIEQISGQSYADYLNKHIFTPAGMTGSGLMPAAPTIRATGMTTLPELDESGPMPTPGAPPPGVRLGPPPGGPNGPPPRPPAGPLRPAAEAELMGTSAGGTFSTPSDMQRFFAALLAGKLTSKAMLAALTSPQITLLPAKGDLPEVFYGLGFGVGKYKGHDWTGHNGGAPGLNVSTTAFPADQTTAVIMTNRDPPAADAMMRKVQAMLFDGETCAR